MVCELHRRDKDTDIPKSFTTEKDLSSMCWRILEQEKDIGGKKPANS